MASFPIQGLGVVRWDSGCGRSNFLGYLSLFQREEEEYKAQWQCVKVFLIEGALVLAGC